MEEVYYQVTDLWKNFCQEHTALLDATFDEYSLLLNSDIEGLEKKTREKSDIIKRITDLEKERSALMKTVAKVGQKKIEHISDLLSIMRSYEDQGQKTKHLEKFNNLLIDIISKIQEQNKKNQVFINKAMASLQDIREGFLGRESFSTYNSKGRQV